MPSLPPSFVLLDSQSWMAEVSLGIDRKTWEPRKFVFNEFITATNRVFTTAAAKPVGARYPNRFNHLKKSLFSVQGYFRAFL